MKEAIKLINLQLIIIYSEAALDPFLELDTAKEACKACSRSSIKLSKSSACIP